MRMEGLSLQQIGAFVAAMFIPWSFKWLWAPMVDIIKLKRFGGRKAWITFCTSMMIVTLIAVAFVDFVANYQFLIWMIVFNNFFCATQDVAIDSLAVSTLRRDERATGNGFMFGGQYLGIGLGGGGALFVSSFWGFNAALIYISALMLINLLFVLVFIRDEAAYVPDPPRRVSAFSHFISTLGVFIRDVYTGFIESGSGPRFGLLFALLPVGAMALAYTLLGTIQVDYGLTEAQISRLSITASFTAGFGCVIGGMLGDRFGVKRVTATFYAMTAIPTLLLANQIATHGLTNIALPVLYATILGHSMLFGMAYAVRIAIFMGMTNPAVAATQFTAYMALSNVAISIGNYWQGAVAGQINYQTALYLDAGLIVLALCVIPFLKNREEKKPLVAATDTVAVAGADLGN